MSTSGGAYKSQGTSAESEELWASLRGLAVVCVSVAGAVVRPPTSTGQFTPFTEHQVNDPNGPDGRVGTPDDDNRNADPPTFKTQHEPWIAVSPAEEGLVFAGWNDDSTPPFFSVGFGKNDLSIPSPAPWTHDLANQIPNPPSPGWLVRQADPGAAIGGNGLFYLCGVNFETSQTSWIFFARSPTGTDQWSVAMIPDLGIPPEGLAFLDNPRMTADFNAVSPTDEVHVHFTRVGRDHQVTLMSSDDAGQNWIDDPINQLISPRVVLGGTPAGYGSFGTVSARGPDQELYVAWMNYEDFCPPGAANCHQVASIVFRGTEDPIPLGWPGTGPFFPPQITVRPNFNSLDNGITKARTNFHPDRLVSWPGIAVDRSG